MRKHFSLNCLSQLEIEANKEFVMCDSLNCSERGFYSFCYLPKGHYNTICDIYKKEEKLKK